MSQFIDDTHRKLHDDAKLSYVTAWKARQVADSAWKEYIEYGKLHGNDNVTAAAIDDDASTSPDA